MGSELVISRWCDRCDSRADGITEHQVRVDGVDRALDLCESCYGGVLKPLLAMLDDLARPAVPEQPAAENNCPICGKSFRTRSLLGNHLNRMHDTTLSGLGLARPTKSHDSKRYAPMTCPECGKQAIGLQGLGAHRLHAHGVKGTTRKEAPKQSQPPRVSSSSIEPSS